MKYQNIREEELKNKVAQDYFWLYDCTKIIGNVDFCVSMHQSQKELFEQESLLWAEAKKGNSDLYKSVVQLILTIGKARTFDKFLPPAFLGAFDGEKIAFIPYNDIQEFFYINDFNWNVTPSNHDTKEFKLVLEKVQSVIDAKALLFYFLRDDRELKSFIKNNFTVGKFGLTKIKIDKNNFISVFNKWLQVVKPTIIMNWENAKKKSIIEADFYLADLISEDNVTLKERLFVRLQKDIYELERKLNDLGMFDFVYTKFNDKQVAHMQFWNMYERPPKEEYWDYIVARRDLLVPQDVRERKGSFFTPQIWVELSQKYLADALGENWQEEYFVWDCAAGTGNLLAGLTNKYNIYVSTLDKQDVEVMHDRIQNGANLLHEHVFQFDFLNDDFVPKSKGGKIPDSLFKIIADPEKRKNLVVYINPPYAESNGRVSISRSSIKDTKIYTKYYSKLEKVGAELFAQFLARIYFELSNCVIAQFSTLKVLSASNSQTFRTHFLASLQKLFVVPAVTFDNVKGSFPIGFFIWDTKKKEQFESFKADVYNADGKLILNKKFYSYDNEKGRINDFLNQYKTKENGFIGVLVADAPDFQNNNFVNIQNSKGLRHGKYFLTNINNLRIAAIYFTVRHCIEATWLNDRDQFLYPNDGWQTDIEFQNDCLAFTLFHGQNRITSQEGTNHWIPFTEQEVNARERFDSNLMSKFIRGKLTNESNGDMFEKQVQRTTPLEFSEEAKAVFDAGRELWKYYHRQPDCDVNASLYDIKAYFQGRNDNGKMNSKSSDETYMQLIGILRDKLRLLAEKTEPKVYLYGFLKP
jgi:hypothetical protein